MDSQTAPLIIEVFSLTTVAAVTFGYAWFLATWVSSRVEPAVPMLHPAVAGLASSALAVPLAILSGTPAAYTIIAALAPLLILSSYVDALTKRIPNAYVLHGMTLIPAAGVWLLLSQDRPDSWWLAGTWSLILAFIAFLLLLGMNLGTRGGLGMGDVKLGAVLAFFLTAIATFTWPDELLTSVLAPLLMFLLIMAWLCISFLAGAVWALARGHLRTGTGFPFGPFLAAGFAASVASTPLIGAAVALI